MSQKSCESVHHAIPRFGFQVTPSSKLAPKLQTLIDQHASDAQQGAALRDVFERFGASMEDFATVIEKYNEFKSTSLCLQALAWEKMAQVDTAECETSLERTTNTSVVSASCAANGGHRDNYGVGQSNMANERIEVKVTFPAPSDGNFRFPGDDSVNNVDWADHGTQLTDWTDPTGVHHGRAPPGCLVYPELLLGTICYWNADIEGHVLHQMFHCSARVGVPEDYLQIMPGKVEGKLLEAIEACNRGAWGLSEDCTPLFYPFGGVITCYRKK
jgi:hypothetical protein